jgi:hypothetical protein
MTAAHGIEVPDQEYGGDWEDCKECAPDTNQDASLEEDLQPEGSKDCKEDHGEISIAIHVGMLTFSENGSQKLAERVRNGPTVRPVW